MTGRETTSERVAIVGPGRVGTALASALPAARYRVVAVAGRGPSALADFRARVPDAVETSPTLAAADADLVLLCVSDDALTDVVRAVARDDGVRTGSRWVHVAGGFGLAPLHPARLAGAKVAACHPAQTFPSPDDGRARLPGAAWAVTADSRDHGWAERLVADLGGRPVRVPDSARLLYHTALTVGSNATAAVVALARDLLAAAGIADPHPFLGPLSTASAAGAAEHGAAALTGPVRRGDAGTVAAHLQELAVVMPEAVDAYRALARLTLSYARRAGLDDVSTAAVAAVLDDDEPGGDDE